jgi:topoisomerase-4 subunit B
MRLDPVSLADEESIADIMDFYMGDNTIDRQRFICSNLRSEQQLEDVNI